MFRFLLSISMAALLAGCTATAAKMEAEAESAPANTTTSTTPSMTDQPTIIYIGDPMCSWCYGIAPELAKLKEAWAGKAEFKVLMGGLRPNATEPIDQEMKDFLAHHWDEVHKRSKQPLETAR